MAIPNPIILPFSRLIFISTITYQIENPAQIPLIPNVTILNFTEINTTAVLQGRIVIGQPVRWKKHIQLEKVTPIELSIPELADNITVSKIENNKKEDVRCTKPSEHYRKIQQSTNRLSNLFLNLSTIHCHGSS